MDPADMGKGSDAQPKEIRSLPEQVTVEEFRLRRILPVSQLWVMAMGSLPAWPGAAPVYLPASKQTTTPKQSDKTRCRERANENARCWGTWAFNLLMKNFR